MTGAYIEQFQSAMPQARVVVIPNGHHYCFIKHAELVFNEMRTFLLEFRWLSILKIKLVMITKGILDCKDGPMNLQDLEHMTGEYGEGWALQHVRRILN